jgi:cobalt-zinc-cadmium efflux system outer membrane protein
MQMKFQSYLFFGPFILFLLILADVSAQKNSSRDTLRLSLQESEKLFLENNFELLASRFQIGEAEGAVIQAKLWDNPTLTIDQGAYNKYNRKWFDISPTGETALSIEQLISLAGKRNKRIHIEKINSEMASLQFYDLMRTLRYELRTSFYSLYFLRQSVSVYDRELVSLKILLNAYESQFQKGNIAFKELARLQALQFNLENERIDLLKDVSEKQNHLLLLTGDTLARVIIPDFSTDYFNHISASQISYAGLLDSALSNRDDLKIAAKQVEAGNADLVLQKALRVPDLHLGVNYDRAGSYINDYNSVSVGIDLPFFNRNQGNIKIASLKIEEEKLLRKKTETQVRSEIANAYDQFIESDRLYKSALPEFTNDFDKLLEGIIKGYQNHTISLLEFIDYYETYKNSKTEFNRLQNNRLEAIENVNLAAGTVILK